MEKFEPIINTPNNPEKEISKIENREIPEQKYINICEEIWKDDEFIKQVCKSFDINLKEWLEQSGINYQAILENNNLNIENLA